MKQMKSLEIFQSIQTAPRLLTLLFALVFFNVTAQNDSIPSESYNVFDADRDYDDYRYNRAQSVFLQMVRDDADFTDKKVIQSLADTYFFNSQYNQSYTWYRKLISLYPEDIKSIYYLRASISARSNENYTIADRYMQQYFRMEKGTVIEDLYVDDLNYLDSIAKLRPKYIVETTKINTEQSDFSSAFYGEDKLVFSSTYQANGQRDYDWTGEPFLDLYIADIGEEGQLENTQQIEGDINTDFHESSAVFSKDLKTVYFTRNNYKNGRKRADRKNTVRLKLLTATVDEDGNWSDVEELPFNNDNYSVAHPALSLDGKKLFFASDMPGTTGESDLWYVDIYKNGSFGDPINLGQKVNTEGRESFPYVADDGTLYFTSDALIGFGGFDVFKAELSDSGIARAPVNMGLPINSAGDDFGFLLQTDTNTGYISSNRDGNRGSASDQIYYFKPSKCVVEITGIVKDSQNGSLMPGATVKLLDIDMNIVAEQIVQQDARYTFPDEVECGQAYFIITENGLAYSIDETTFVAPTTSQSVNMDMEIETFSQDCPPYDLGCLLGLNPIYFDLNKYYIRPDAEIELTKVFNAMNRFSDLIVRIESHTDSRSPQTYNQRLSQNRATSTRNWLIQRGIAPSRLSAVGYGESQLINRCADGVPCTEAEHQLNRRSMFIIENYSMTSMSTAGTSYQPRSVPNPTPASVANKYPVPPKPPVRRATPPPPPVAVMPPPPPVMTPSPTQNYPVMEPAPSPVKNNTNTITTSPDKEKQTSRPPKEIKPTVTPQPSAISIKVEDSVPINKESTQKTDGGNIVESPTIVIRLGGQSQEDAAPKVVQQNGKGIEPVEESTKGQAPVIPKGPPIRTAAEAMQILRDNGVFVDKKKAPPTEAIVIKWKDVPALEEETEEMPVPEMPADLHNEESPIDILEEIIANQQIKNQGKDVKISEKPSKSEASGLHIVFKVQIAALINKRDVNHKVFMGLSGLSIEKSKEFNRYLYRPTRSYKQAEIAKKYVISKGFKKAFVVAYVNGIRTSAWEAAKWKQQAP